LGLGQQPLLEHEFIELFVRVVLEFALRHGYDPSKHDTVTGDGTKEVCWAWMTPCQIVEKILAERVKMPFCCCCVRKLCIQCIKKYSILCM
jgi:hypothetical protein